MQGAQPPFTPGTAADFAVAYVLAAAFILEGVSFVQALRQARGKREFRHHHAGGIFD